tara:strand:- start:217 stop:396 length:180 start_codon:yes stop_codon:yes gene_type:complete
MNEKTMETITNYDTKDQNKFLKTLVDEGLLEIVNVDVADNDYKVDNLNNCLLKENVANG